MGARIFLPICALLSGCATVAPPTDRNALDTPLGVTAPIEAWIEKHPQADASQRAEAYGALCDVYTRVGRYREAADACLRKAELAQDGDSDSRNSIAFRRALSQTPPIRARGDVDVPLSYGWTGMAEVSARANRVTTQWGVDTGAQVSVVSETDAGRLGVRMLDGSLHLGGSTPGSASGGVGLIDHLQIAGTDIDNVPVFVLPDAALTPAPGHVVPPILGAPVLYAFGRVEFSDHGRRLRMTAGHLPLLSTHMTWNPSGVAFDIGLPLGRVHVFLDTGANSTELRSSTRALLNEDERAALTQRPGKSAGVTGVISDETWESRAIDVGLGDALCRLPRLRFGEASSAGADAHPGIEGRLGIDLVKACREFTLDFTTMTLEAHGS